MTDIIQIHALQTLGPNCINRDDTGAPKTTTLGGVTRLRVSSQAWKKAIRDGFREHLPQAQLSVRTKRLPEAIVDRMNGIDHDEAISAANEIAKTALSNAKTTEKKDTVESEALALFGYAALDQLADLTRQAIDSGDVKTWIKDTDNKRAIKHVITEDKAIDLCLFGRMVASDPDYGVEAAACVANTIGVEPYAPMFDYFAAVDEMQGADEKGAGMLGLTPFSSSTVYRYATVDLDTLTSQIGHDEAVNAAIAFVNEFVRTIPQGRVHSFASDTLPDYVRVEHVHTQPVSLVGAFTVPIHATDVVRTSIQRLQERAKAVGNAFQIAPSFVGEVNVPDGEGNLPQLLDDLRAELA